MTTIAEHPMGAPAQGRPAERIGRILAHVRGPDVLDVGAASHRPNPDSPHWLHGHLLRLFPASVGIDLDADHVGMLCQMGYENIRAMNAEQMELGRRFDTIVAGELIEHLSNPAQFLERACRHLKPDGRLVLTTPFPFSFYYGLRAVARYPQTCANPDHTCWFCPTTMRETARRAGLRIESLELIEHYHYGARYSVAYWVFTSFMWLARHMMPRRLRCNEMLVVMRPH